MKITKKEVKTIYSITIDEGDVVKAFGYAEAERDRLGIETFRTLYKDAFNQIISQDEEELKMVEVREYAKRIVNNAIEFNNVKAVENNNTIEFIVKQWLKFDGIQHYGISKKDKRTLTVYNEGCEL